MTRTHDLVGQGEHGHQRPMWLFTHSRTGDDRLDKYFKGESFAKGTPVTV